MTAELEVAYLGIQVADQAGFGTFLRDIVGLTPGEPTADGATTWRNDDRVHRILVEEGPANDAVFVGLEARTPEVFTQAVDRARAAGASVTDGTAAEAAAAPHRRARPRRHAVGRPVRARARAGHRARPVRLAAGARRLRHQGPGLRPRRVRRGGPRRPPTSSPGRRSGSRSRTGSRRTSAGFR